MTKEEFKKIRQSLKLNGGDLAKRLGQPKMEVLAYEMGTKSIPDHIAKYLRAISSK